MLPVIGELAVDHVLSTLVLIVSKINGNLLDLGNLTQILGDVDVLAEAGHIALVEAVIFALENASSTSGKRQEYWLLVIRVAREAFILQEIADGTVTDRIT